MIKRGTRHHQLLRVPKEFEDISFSETAHWTAGDVVSPDFDKVREEDRVVSERETCRRPRLLVSPITGPCRQP